nr:MAG TPA_asm: zinc-ribbon containing domain protein [Caudoviricetes sp.]
MEHAPYERLKWRVLRYAGALPSEKRAQEMTDADYLYCLTHELLDREEALERLCPACRERAGEARCSACGTPLAETAGGGNESFDMARFLRLKEGRRT